MPKVLEHTAPWLSRPAPGCGLFSDKDTDSNKASPKRHLAVPNGLQGFQYSGPRRLIAQRGTEVFSVVGKQIRWADLALLKKTWEQRNSGSQPHETNLEPYQILNVSIHQEIRQIIPSISGHFLAILTSHTVYYAPLPDRSHLLNSDGKPLKLTTWQIGRTAHCLGDGRSPVITALWHPLASANNHQDCLVTITTDAVVRLWELDAHSKYSLDNPALAVDMKKLVDGRSCDDDFAPSQFGRNQGYSPDIFDMEVASAVFGGAGVEDEDGWAAMTLWIAMKTGDVYALCPLLPSKWVPSPTAISSLSTSVVSKWAGLGDNAIDPEQAKAIRQQYQWVLQIDDEQPVISAPDSELGPSVEIRKRPSDPSPIPRLQGPFDLIFPDDQLDDFEVSDICVFPARVSTDNIYEDVEVEADDLTDLSTTIVCLSTTSGDVFICLNLDGVEGQWLPKSRKGAFGFPETVFPEMIVIDSISGPGSVNTSDSTPSSQWPTFTVDPVTLFSFWLTTASTIQFYSLANWIPRFESELNAEDLDNDEDSGLLFRLKVLCESDVTLHEETLRLQPRNPEDTNLHLSQSLVSTSISLGYFLLTTNAEEPYSILLDEPSPSIEEELELPVILKERPPLPEPAPPRQSYAPNSIFYDPSATGALQRLTSQIPARYKTTFKSEIRLSPVTLDVMTNSHRALSGQTASLERGAAELFRRIERLRSEVGDAVQQMTFLAERVQQLHESMAESEKGTFDERITNISTRQQELNSRYEKLKRKASRIGQTGNQTRDLNPKEAAWIEEIKSIGKTVGIEEENDIENDAETESTTLKARYEKVKSLTSTLLSQLPPPPPQQQQQQSHPTPPPSPPQPSTNTATTDPLLPSHFPNTPQTEKSLQDSLLLRPHSSSSSRPSSSRSNTNANHIFPSSPAIAGAKPAGAPMTKLQKAKIAEALSLVEREGAVIQGALRRLERLSLGGPAAG